MATSLIRIKKICAWCGKEFEAQKLSTQFCSHRCSSHAYKDKKRQEKKQSAETASQRSQQKKTVEDIKDKDYLTVSEAAQLLGFTRDGVYKLIYRGLLKAHRITSHWTVIYRKDIDLLYRGRISLSIYNVSPVFINFSICCTTTFQPKIRIIWLRCWG